MKFVPTPWDDSKVRREVMTPIYDESEDLMFSYFYARVPSAQSLMHQFKKSKSLWVDSSGYQVGQGRAPKSSIFDVFDLQKEWADFALTFDSPAEPEQTFRNAILSLAYSNGLERKPKMYAVVSHNGSPILAREFARKYEEYDFDGVAIGGTLPYGSSNMAELFSLISSITRATTKPIHALGIGGFDAMYLLALLGVSSFDSSRFITAAKGLNYLTPHGTLYVGTRYIKERARAATMGPLPCECSACRKGVTFGFFQERGAEPVAYLALHNYYVMRNEVRLINIAQREGWFKSLIEGRARRSPRLRSVLNQIRSDPFVKGSH